MKKCWIVTGANGHVGNTVVRLLLEKQQRVIAMVLPGDTSQALQGLDVEIVKGDLVNPEDIEHLFSFVKNIDSSQVIVIHTAGIVSIDFKEKELIDKVNFGGTRNIVDACVNHQIGKLIYTSSVHALPERSGNQPIREAIAFDPKLVEGLYAKSKASASQYVINAIQQGLNANIVFPSGILGPGDFGNSHMTQFVLDYLEGRLTAYVEGGYDFVDVRDVSETIIKIAATGAPGENYLLSNRFISAKEMLDILSKVSNQKEVKLCLPMWLAKSTAPLAEVYYRLIKQKPLFTRYSLMTLKSNSNFDHTKASLELDYHPRDPEDSLRDAVGWLIAHKRVKATVK